MKLPFPLRTLYKRLLSDRYSNVKATQTNNQIVIKGVAVYFGEDYLIKTTFNVGEKGLRFDHVDSAPVDDR